MGNNKDLSEKDRQLIDELFHQLANEKSRYKLTYQQIVDYEKLKKKYENGGLNNEEDLLLLQQVARNLKTEKAYPIANIKENLKKRIANIDALTPERLFAIMDNLTEEKVAEIMEPGAFRLSMYADTILHEYRTHTTVDSLKTRMRNFLTKSTLDNFQKASPVERIQYLMLCYILDEAYRMSQE